VERPESPPPPRFPIPHSETSVGAQKKKNRKKAKYLIGFLEYGALVDDASEFRDAPQVIRREGRLGTQLSAIPLWTGVHKEKINKKDSQS
jgi:hypothetical protein